MKTTYYVTLCRAAYGPDDSDPIQVDQFRYVGTAYDHAPTPNIDNAAYRKIIGEVIDDLGKTLGEDFFEAKRKEG